MLSLFFDDQQETQTSMPCLPTPHSPFVLSPSCPRLPCSISWAVTYLFRPQQVCPLPTLELFQHLRKTKTQSLVRTELLAVIRPGRSRGPNPVPTPTPTYLGKPATGIAPVWPLSSGAQRWAPGSHRVSGSLAGMLEASPNPEKERGSVEFS